MNKHKSQGERGRLARTVTRLAGQLFALCSLLLALSSSALATDFGDISRATDVSTLWVPPSRTLTINGSTQDLSANRTWSVGTVTDFSAGDLSPLFTTSEATTTTTPALTFSLSNAAAHSYFGNNTGSSGAPGFHVIDYVELSGTPTIPSEIFKTIAVSGQSDVVADSATDTLTLAAGSNVTITTNASTDTVTIAATGGGTDTHAVTFVVDGSGSVLTSGTKAYVKIPYGGTLQGWTLIGSPSGSITCDIYRATDTNGLPTVSIVGGGGTKPALSTAVENSSTSFSGWTSTTLNAADNLAVNLSGITSTTYVCLTLYFE